MCVLSVEFEMDILGHSMLVLMLLEQLAECGAVSVMEGFHLGFGRYANPLHFNGGANNSGDWLSTREQSEPSGEQPAAHDQGWAKSHFLLYSCL